MQDYEAIRNDVQVRHMGSFVTVPGTGETGATVTVVNHPILYDGEAAEVRLPPHTMGAQTAEILGDLGLAEGETDRIAANGIVRLAGT